MVMNERIVDWPDFGLKLIIPILDIDAEVAELRKQFLEDGQMCLPATWKVEWYPSKGEDDGQ